MFEPRLTPLQPRSAPPSACAPIHRRGKRPTLPPQTPAPPAIRPARASGVRSASFRLADGRRRLLQHRLRRIQIADRHRAPPSALGQPWSELAAALGLDPDGQMARAFASHDTWSGITVAFPVDDSGARLAVELSGLPVFDRDRNFRGYRGFGVCRDGARIGELTRTRRAPTPAAPRVEPPVFRDEPPRRRAHSRRPKCRAVSPPRHPRPRPCRR